MAKRIVSDVEDVEVNDYKRWVIEAEEKFVDDAEARQFVKKAQRGNELAMESIVRRNIPMLYKFALSYAQRGSDTQDLVSEGMLSIMDAVRRFNVKSDITVGTALITAVRTAMRRYVGADRNVHIAINASENKAKIHAVIERMKAEGETPTIEEIAIESNFPIETVKRLVKIELGVVSMNEKADGDEGEGNEFGDSIADESATPYEQTAQSDAMDMIMKALDCLNETEKIIIEYRYGLNGKETKNLAQIGKIINRTTERVRQLERDALKKIRKIVL